MSALSEAVEMTKGVNASYDATLGIKRRVEKLKYKMEQERAPFIEVWKDVNDYILPSRGMSWLREDRSSPISSKILDNTASLASDILVSGLLSGMAGPTIRWFALEHPDFRANEIYEVQEWTHESSEITHSNLLKTNAYNNFNLVFKDCSGFGTAAMLMERDFKNYLRTEVFEAGSYLISQNANKEIDTFIRETRMSVRQIVEKFCTNPLTNEADLSNVSNSVAHNWKKGNHEEQVNITHAIYPNEKYDPMVKSAFYNKKYRSVYYEGGSGNGMGSSYGVSSDSKGNIHNQKVLYVSGYSFFPVLCPRWQRNSTDAYGVDCPAWQSLGDVIELQSLRQDKLDNSAQYSRPAMIGPTDLENAGPSLIPNSTVYFDEREDQKGFRPIVQTNMNYVAALSQDEQIIRERIENAWYKKVLLAIIDKNAEMTKYETMERLQEKKQILGPMNIQFIRDFLEPFINNAFTIFAERGLYAPAPSEIQGTDLKIEYVSDIAKAQRTAGVRDIEDFMMFAMQTSQSNPEVMDVVNFDEGMREIVERRGIPPSLIRPKDMVAKMREQRRQRQMMQEQVEQMKDRAGAVKSLAGASLEGDNALTNMMGQGGQQIAV